ncbi:MAG: VOC family protein [Acidobacteria bacterium]|nr:VOC family protein [Acidobacteriota bacterium]
MSRVPALGGLLESALYVDDPKRSVEFYNRVFGFECIADFDRLCAMAVPNGTVLLLFRKGGTDDTDGDGRLHVAFSIPATALADWESWLAANGIEIEKRQKWERGGESLYFRDPDGHLLEVATPGVWLVY